MSAPSDDATIATVNTLKAALAKELPLENGANADDDSALERCRDLLKQLDECEMNLKVLSETLIGTVVSKYKSHTLLGASAKLLIKKWKKAARDTNPASRKMKLKAAAAETPSQEWLTLPSLRQNICKKLYSSMFLSKKEITDAGVGDEAFGNMCVSAATEIEDAMNSKLQGAAYSEKARSLCFNLKKNAAIRFDLLMGTTSASELIVMPSDELATAEKTQERESSVSKLHEGRQLDWEQQNEGKINEMCGIRGDLLKASLFTCSRCKSIKTTSTQKQTRSADEPMTVFVLCMNCGNRWKC